MVLYLCNRAVTEGYIYIYIQTVISNVWIYHFSRMYLPCSLPRDRADDEDIYF